MGSLSALTSEEPGCDVLATLMHGVFLLQLSILLAYDENTRVCYVSQCIVPILPGVGARKKLYYTASSRGYP